MASAAAAAAVVLNFGGRPEPRVFPPPVPERLRLSCAFGVFAAFEASAASSEDGVSTTNTHVWLYEHY